MYWVATTLYTFFSIIIGQIIIDEKFKIVFYLTMLLLWVSLNNIYYSSKYYILLRNFKGIKGDRGDPGDPGQDGSNGVCLMANKCGIVDCKSLIIDQLMVKFPEYKKINQKLNDNLKLTPTETKIQEMIDKYINILLPKCENTEETTEDFIKTITKTIENSN